MSDQSNLRVAFFTPDDPFGRSGIERFTTDLLHALVERQDLTMVPVVSPHARAALCERLPGGTDLIVTRAARGALRSVEERLLLAQQLRSAHVDLVHGTKHILPARPSCPTVLTAYDLFPFARRGEYRWSKRLLLPAVFRRSLCEADRVIAMTDSVRHQIIDAGLVDQTKIDVVPAAPSTELTEAIPESVAALDRSAFALCVGDLSPRKNIGLLLRIWPTVHRRTGLRLALVGPDRSRSEAVRARITSLEAAGVVVRLGEVSEGILRWCYEHAIVTLIPSLEEGYGLPAIEALHFGARLVTSRDAALVEVSGAEVLHLDATDDEGWVQALLTIDRAPTSPKTVTATSTWQNVASLTADVYHRAVALARAQP